MYRHVGLRATLLGGSTSGVAGAVGTYGRLPAPLRLLLLLAAGGLTLYLIVSVALLLLAVAFRLHSRVAHRPTRPSLLDGGHDS